MLSPTWYALPAVVAAGVAGNPALPDRADPPAIRIRWLGHAAFEVVSPGGTRMLIDPWLLENPSTPAAYRDTTLTGERSDRARAVIATHPHGDHDGDVALLARVTGAQGGCHRGPPRERGDPEGGYLSINIGGVQRIGDVEVQAVPAMHSSSRAAPGLRAAVRGRA